MPKRMTNEGTPKKTDLIHQKKAVRQNTKIPSADTSGVGCRMSVHASSSAPQKRYAPTESKTDASCACVHG